MSEDANQGSAGRPRRRWKWLKRGLVALLVLGAVVFLARRQIGGILARTLDERLVAAGIYVDWESAARVSGSDGGDFAKHNAGFGDKISAPPDSFH